MKKILILAGDVLPFPGYPTTGAGLRAWSIGQGLSNAGFKVYYSIPEIYVKGNATAERELSWHPDDREKPIRLVKPDLIVVCHWPAMPDRKLDIPTILDLHGPHLMERRFWQPKQVTEGIIQKIKAFQKADFFTCAGERQRYYFMNWLLLAGFELTSSLIAVIPVSLSADIPNREFILSADNSPIIVYGGMFLPWQDPVMPIKTLLSAMNKTKKGKLHVFGGPHPLVKDSSGRFKNLMSLLKQHQRVSIMTSTPHEELISFYLKANIAFDLMLPNLERELAFTTRTIEYLWCGLPVIYNDSGELSNRIENANAGWIIPPDNPKNIEEKLCEILVKHDEINQRGINAQNLIRSELSWNKTMQPLIDFCNNPILNAPKYPDISTDLSNQNIVNSTILSKKSNRNFLKRLKKFFK